jgi:hypothetical protein
MKDTDDRLLVQHLSGDPPDKAFKEQELRDSLAAFNQVRWLRSAWRRGKLAAAAVLIAGVAFLGGRLSIPSKPIGNVVEARRPIVESDGVTVPTELVAWVEAARLFRQLGMEDRMARAVERAGRLLPADTFIADGQAGQVFAAGFIENHTERVESMGMPGPHPSTESVNQILAQSFGD